MMADGDFIVNSYPLVRSRGARATEEAGPLAVHHYRDVTEEKRLQRKLIQSEKMAAIGMLAGGVAHEINNPLAGILAFAQLLKNELTNPEAQSDLNEIEQAAKRCKKIVEDLLMFARPHGETELKKVALTEAVDQILPLAKLNLKHRNVTLATHYATSLPPVRGNQARLQQVFLNLINNAAQSMNEGGEVAVGIAAGPGGSQVVAEVKDRGSGIRKEDIAKIFDPFYTTKGREGTGLGLSICYSIISEHGGKLEVESEVGVGSVFRVILPAAPVVPVSPVSPVSKEESHGKVHTRH
jgi:two-component system NtrC family sensor kinase